MHEPDGNKEVTKELDYKHRELVTQLTNAHERSRDQAAGSEVLCRKGQPDMCIVARMRVASVDKQLLVLQICIGRCLGSER